MVFILKDRVEETSTTTGTGDITLDGAKSNYQSFSSVCSVSDTFWYAILHSGTDWETGLGTYSSSDTITRTTVFESSNGGALVDFAAGTKDVFIGLPASKSTQLNTLGGPGDIRWGFDATPAAWEVELDGSTIVGGVASYPAVASRYSWMVSGADLVLPDIRGHFPRIWANGSSNDPDRASRTASVSGGPTGDNPGTRQVDAFKSHTHTLNNADNILREVGGAKNTPPAGSWLTSTITANNTGGNETRPLNINMSAHMRLL